MVPNPFENAGIVINGLVYTYKVIPDYSGPYTTLGDILVKDGDIPDEYYLNEADLDQWKFMKGKKELKRTSKDGFEYNYTEGSMPFPDPLDKPARTLITSEVSASPNNKEIQKTPPC